MSGPQFFQTGMGVRFFERDLPRLLDALETLAALAPGVADSFASLIKLEASRLPANATPDPNESSTQDLAALGISASQHLVCYHDHDACKRPDECGGAMAHLRKGIAKLEAALALATRHRAQLTRKP